MQVRSLGRKGPLEKEMANHSIIPAWKIPWAEEPGGLQFMGLQTVEHNWVSIYSFNSCYNIASPLQSWGNEGTKVKKTCSRSRQGVKIAFFFLFTQISLTLLFSRSVMFHSLIPHELQPTWLLCVWNSPGKNTAVGSHSLLHGIFPTQGANLSLLHYNQIL